MEDTLSEKGKAEAVRWMRKIGELREEMRRDKVDG